MKIVNKRQYNEKTKVVDLQIDEIHNFAIGKSGTVVHNSHIRPRGTLIKGIGVGTPGVLAFMEVFDKTSDVITRGSVGETFQTNGVHTKKGIRKGAMISLLSVRHPEIFDYVEAKKVPNRLTKFNMSVKVTDEFMQAVEQGKNWDLWFPDVHFEKYDTEWMGDFEDWDAKGYPKVVYKTVAAIELWTHILKNMYNRNEPGLIYIDNANRNNNLLYKQKIVATNPCFTGDTMILTSEGSKRIDSLVGQTAKIYDGEQWVEVDNFRVTGENQDVYRVELVDGRHIDATAYHRFILEDGTVKELKDLQVGEKLKQNLEQMCCGNARMNAAYLKGFMIGDGCEHDGMPILWLYSGKEMCKDRILESASELKFESYNGHKLEWSGMKEISGKIRNTVRDKLNGLVTLNRLNPDDELSEWGGKYKQKLPDFVHTLRKEDKLEFLAGLFDSDGCVMNGAKGFGYQLSSIHKSLLQDVQILLLSLGVYSRIGLMKKAGRVDFNDGYGEYDTQDCWRLTIAQRYSIELAKQIKFSRVKSLEDKSVSYTCKIRGNKIKSIEFLKNAEKVYCCTVNNTHKVLISNGILTCQCAEITMLSDPFEHNGIKAHGDICNLGHINLTAYFQDDAQQEFPFDFAAFAQDAELLVEALDNIIDISAYPLPELKNAALFRRKVGCGIMGYASLLMMMGYRYNSPEAQKFTDKLMSIYVNTLYKKSALLAKEKGPFQLCEIDKMMNNGFIKNSGVLTDDTLETIRKYGLRNSQLLTIAPTGNTSIFMGLVSGGLEPIFEREYNRWVEQRNDYSALDGKKYPNLATGEWFDTKDFRKKLWGDEEVLESVWNDGQYVLHKSRGLIKRVACSDFGWEWVKKNRSTEWITEKEQQGVFACAMDLTVKDHVDTLTTMSRYVDNSISKTINLSNDYPYSDFDSMFRQLWKDGVRGVTTYRAGTMSAVLEVKKPTQTVKQEQDDFFKEWESHNGNVVQESIKLPTEYPMHGYIVRSENKKWYFHAAFKDRACKKPFAVFVHTNATEPNVTTYNALDLLEELAYTENVPECHIERTKTMCKTQTNVAKLTRMVALLLRHNVKIIKIVQTLESVECNVTSFIYAFKKFMMKFVPNNTETGEKCPSCSGTILFTEGCVQCKDCGWQKC